MTKDTDEKYLKKACEILSHGRSHPAIFNDEVISEGLRLYGVSEEDSKEYIHSTCVEITPVSASSIWVASPYTNLPQILLDLLSNDYPDFQSLLKDYFSVLSDRIQANYKAELAVRDDRRNRALAPLLSCFVNDCLEKGRDIEQDGARYRWIMPSFVGMGNLVDCLFVLKKHVFEQRTFTLAQIKEIIEKNFEGFEAERLLFLNGTEKYGNGVQEIDELFSDISQRIIALCKLHSKTYGEADGKNRLVPSVFCWIMHERFGRETGATPDGRKAGFPLGDGSGPCQGREKNGPLTSILSSTSWEHKEFIGGVAVNMKFSKKAFTSNSLNNIVALVKTYLERGGFELQINVLDRETLLSAQQNPELHQDLVVRIGGYSDYFVRLSPQMQAEVLLRTEHEV
jgi:formate C-acetyltransferase